MRSDVPAFINGDRCQAQDGSIGYVRECKGAKGPYLKVYVSQGARAGAWEWPEKFCRRPEIDWSVDGHSTACVECGRWFNGGIDASGLRRMFCKTCDSFHGKQEARRSKDAGPSHSFGANRPRVYRRDGGDRA